MEVVKGDGRKEKVEIGVFVSSWCRAAPLIEHSK